MRTRPAPSVLDDSERLSVVVTELVQLALRPDAALSTRDAVRAVLAALRTEPHLTAEDQGVIDAVVDNLG